MATMVEGSPRIQKLTRLLAPTPFMQEQVRQRCIPTWTAGRWTRTAVGQALTRTRDAPRRVS
jgi:hypothetical protein